MMNNLRIDAERLWSSLMETAAFGASAGGLKRLTLSDEDKQVRDWLVARCRAAGCEVSVDQVGNIFARRPGRRPDLPAVAFGSHLDTQPTGGRFDGILGVLAGLEVLQTLEDAGYTTEAPLELIDWTNEEGARFPPAMMGSGVFAGKFSAEHALGLRDRCGVSFESELRRIGYAGPDPVGAREFAAYIELHIEQGPVLEAQERAIGVVTGVQGIRWFDVEISGVSAHAGTTPMPNRFDAFQAAARFAVAIDAIARQAAPDAVATIGCVTVEPGSPNVVPSRARLTLDLRHPREADLIDLEVSVRSAAETIAKSAGVGVAITETWRQAPVVFDRRCVDIVRDAAESEGLSHQDIVSGAGHDAVHLAALTPTAMIFVPCDDGISHNEAELISPEQAAAGAAVLLRAVLSLADGAAAQA